MCSHSVGLCERVAMYRKRIDIKGSQKAVTASLQVSANNG